MKKYIMFSLIVAVTAVAQEPFDGDVVMTDAVAQEPEVVVSDTDVIMADSETEVDLNMLQDSFVRAVLKGDEQSIATFEKAVYDGMEYAGIKYARPAFQALLPEYIEKIRALHAAGASTRALVSEIVHMPEAREFLAYLYDTQSGLDAQKKSGITTFAIERKGPRGHRFMGGGRRAYIFNGKTFYTSIPSAGPAARLRGSWGKLSRAVQELQAKFQ